MKINAYDSTCSPQVCNFLYLVGFNPNIVPTLSSILENFRIEHNLIISAVPYKETGWTYTIQRIGCRKYNNEVIYKTTQNALEAGIMYVLQNYMNPTDLD